VLAPLIGAFLGIGIASVAWSARSPRHAGPLVATLLGAAAIVAGRLVGRVPAALFSGVVRLVGASLWNLWLKRPRRTALEPVRLVLDRQRGDSP
jgi:hypothetical protein